MFRQPLYYFSVIAASVSALWLLGPSLEDLRGLMNSGEDELLVESGAPELPFITLPDYLIDTGSPAADGLATDAMASLPGDELFIFGAPASGDSGSAEVPGVVDFSSLPPTAAGPGGRGAGPEETDGAAPGRRDFTSPDSAPGASGPDFDTPNQRPRSGPDVFVPAIGLGGGGDSVASSAAAAESADNPCVKDACDTAGGDGDAGGNEANPDESAVPIPHPGGILLMLLVAAALYQRRALSKQA